MAHDVVAAPNPVELETGLLKGRNDGSSGEDWQPAWRHGQAAIVR